MRSYRWPTVVVIALWLAVALATIDYNGPFFDEGIYITAGQRTLEGHGYSDGYLSWFAGSLLWPILAALGYQGAGLVGTRLVALLMAFIALIAVAGAARNLFGPPAGFWTAVALALSGPFMALARLGVYDLPSVAGIAVSFWAITQLQHSDHRSWLAVAAVAFAVAMLSKYPTGLMLLPLCAVLILLRREKAVMDLGIMGLIVAAIVLALFLPAREQIVALVAWQVANKPLFGVTPAMIAYALLYASAAPLALALGGWLAARPQRALATLLLLSMAIWPAYHLVSKNPVGPDKHVVLGFLFAYPLGGLALSRFWDREGHRALRRSLVIFALLVLGALGTVQAQRAARAWPDARQAARFLVEHVQPGEKLLINESWVYTMYLYTERRIESPWDVFDVYRITHGESKIELCAYDWFVDSKHSYAWPQQVWDEVAQCGGFEQVYSSEQRVVGLGSDLRFVEYPIEIAIWKNTRR